jgi:S-adenosylmethionine-diacylglycerol 3-amino-3-carboxypropyl transferase
VREDAAAELAALTALGPGRDVFCIGSGGCTALSLLVARPRAVQAVDINPAQIHLIELKRAAVAQLSSDDLIACVTRDARPYYPSLRRALSAAAASFWDARADLLARGLTQCGEIERRLRQAMRLFRVAVHPRARIEEALGGTDVEAQRRFYVERWATPRFRAALATGLSRPVLRLIYGRAVLDALPADFARLVAGNLAHAFTATPARENGYLWQTFLGRYPPSSRGLPIYLQPEHHQEVKDRIGALATSVGEAAGWLGRVRARSFDFFALSNILEISRSDEVAPLLSSIAHAARPGALICLRWILPPPRGVMEALGARWQEQADQAREIEAIDRSPFCRFIRLYRV